MRAGGAITRTARCAIGNGRRKKAMAIGRSVKKYLEDESDEHADCMVNSTCYHLTEEQGKAIEKALRHYLTGYPFTGNPADIELLAELFE